MAPEQPWHKYVFDTEQRRFVGDFEGMYRAEREQGFDSWHQSDERRLDTLVAEALVKQLDFDRALDLGCGKGHFAAYLAEHGASVTGVDLSPTAIEAARERYPHVDWVAAPALDHLRTVEHVDLIVVRELLSYLEDWRELIAAAAPRCRHLLVGLYVPPDPIGYVKSHAELEDELRRSFEIVETVDLRTRLIAVHLCASR